MTNEEKNFFRLKQNQATNFLSRFTTSKYEIKSDDKNKVKLKQSKFNFTYGSCEIILLLDSSCSYGLNATTQKLYRYICCQFTERGCNENQILLHMPTLLANLGLKDYNSNREIIKKDCESLLRTNIRWSSKDNSFSKTSKNKKSKKNKTPKGAFNLISSYKFCNNYLTIEICSDLLAFMKKWSLVNYPKSALQIGGKNRYSFALVDKIIETSRQRSSFAISVKSLFVVCVFAGMPTIDEVKTTSNRSFKEKIIDPFEHALDNNNGLFEWIYRENTEHKKFEEWLNDYIIISNYMGGDSMQ